MSDIVRLLAQAGSFVNSNPSLALIAASAGASAAGQIGGGIAARNVARQEADRLEAMGRIEADEQRRRARKLIGRQRALFGKAGVEQSGTVVDVLAETAETEELNALRAAFGFDVRAATRRAEGAQALTQGIFGAATTLLGTGARIAQQGSKPAVPKTLPEIGTGGRAPDVGIPRQALPEFGTFTPRRISRRF